MSESHHPPTPLVERGAPKGGPPPRSRYPPLSRKKSTPEKPSPPLKGRVRNLVGTVEFGKSSPLFRTRVEAHRQHQGRHPIVVGKLGLAGA
jgi:hypothetical protein